MTDITLEQRARELLDAESAFVWPARQYNAALRAITAALRSAQHDFSLLLAEWQQLADDGCICSDCVEAAYLHCIKTLKDELSSIHNVNASK